MNKDLLLELPDALQVVEFWRDAGPKKWFAKDEAFDRLFRERFFDLHFAVARREREPWLSQAYGSLASILLLDQFPRNAFRGTAHCYATDDLARRYARATLEANRIDLIDDSLKVFVLTPFMHSECLNDQRYATELYRRYSPANIKHAIGHAQIIRRFGRFPHRNGALGRTTTAAEREFLDGGGFAG